MTRRYRWISLCCRKGWTGKTLQQQHPSLPRSSMVRWRMSADLRDGEASLCWLHNPPAFPRFFPWFTREKDWNSLLCYLCRETFCLALCSFSKGYKAFLFQVTTHRHWIFITNMMLFFTSAFICLLVLYVHTYHKSSYLTTFNTLFIPPKSKCIGDALAQTVSGHG